MILVSPKSAIFTSDSLATRMFLAARSLWTKRRDCRYSIPWKHRIYPYMGRPTVEQGMDAIPAHAFQTDLTDLRSKKQHPPCVDLVSVIFQVANEAATWQVLHHQTHTEMACKQFAGL